MAGADVLMNETLPTVIGAGVVSRTTDTMFGRGGRSRTSRGRARRTAPSKSQMPKVHRGPRGGKYIIKHGRRIYI